MNNNSTNNKKNTKSIPNIVGLVMGCIVGFTFNYWQGYKQGIKHEQQVQKTERDKYYEIYLECDYIGNHDTIQLQVADHLDYDNLGRLTSYRMADVEHIAPIRANPMYNLSTANAYDSKKYPIHIYLRQRKW